MVKHYGLDVVQAYMGHVKIMPPRSVRRVLDALPDGSFELALDHGGAIKVSITVDKDARQARLTFLAPVIRFQLILTPRWPYAEQRYFMCSDALLRIDIP